MNLSMRKTKNMVLMQNFGYSIQNYNYSLLRKIKEGIMQSIICNIRRCFMLRNDSFLKKQFFGVNILMF